MKKLILVAALLSSVSSFAGTPKAVTQAATSMKSSAVRTVVTEVTTTDGGPCSPDIGTYVIEIQVKQASFNHETSKTEYSWETAKSVNVDAKGKVLMEVCGE